MSQPFLEVEHHGKTYAMTPEMILNELIYSCYAFNRQQAHEITPGAWSSLFPTALQMEQRFQKEQEK